MNPNTSRTSKLSNDEISDIKGRLIRLEEQVDRIVSDMESEKGTRGRVNDKVDERLGRIERIVWMASGGVVVAQGIFVTIVLMLMKHFLGV